MIQGSRCNGVSFDHEDSGWMASEEDSKSILEFQNWNKTYPLTSTVKLIPNLLDHSLKSKSLARDPLSNSTGSSLVDLRLEESICGRCKPASTFSRSPWVDFVDIVVVRGRLGPKDNSISLTIMRIRSPRAHEFESMTNLGSYLVFRTGRNVRYQKDSDG